MRLATCVRQDTHACLVMSVTVLSHSLGAASAAALYGPPQYALRRLGRLECFRMVVIHPPTPPALCDTAPRMQHESPKARMTEVST